MPPGAGEARGEIGHQRRFRDRGVAGCKEGEAGRNAAAISQNMIAIFQYGYANIAAPGRLGVDRSAGENRLRFAIGEMDPLHVCRLEPRLFQRFEGQILPGGPLYRRQPLALEVGERADRRWFRLALLPWCIPFLPVRLP